MDGSAAARHASLALGRGQALASLWRGALASEPSFDAVSDGIERLTADRAVWRADFWELTVGESTRLARDPPYQMEERMKTIEESIEIEVPVSTAYNQWTQFESFPKFMDGVKRVDQHDDTRLHWVAEIGGDEREWDAEITEQHPDHRVAWKALNEEGPNGVVTFHKLGDSNTKVMVQMEYEPEGITESIGSFVGLTTTVSRATSSRSRSSSSLAAPRVARGAETSTRTERSLASGVWRASARLPGL